VVLGAHHALHPLTRRGAGAIDDVADLRGADEGDGGDVRMLEQLVHLLGAAVHHVQHPLRCARLHEQLDQAHRRQGHLLRGLEHEGVAAGDGQGKHPQGQHRRKVEGGDAEADAQGLRVAVTVDATGHVLHGLTHEQRGNVGRVLHDLDATPDIAFGILEGLARIAGEDLAQFVVVLLEQGLVTQHQPRPLRHRHLAPALEGLARAGDSEVHLLGRGKGHLGEGLLRGRIQHRHRGVTAAVEELAVDEQGNLLAHFSSLLATCGTAPPHHGGPTGILTYRHGGGPARRIRRGRLLP
jgi:hypothetical protein